MPAFSHKLHAIKIPSFIPLAIIVLIMCSTAAWAQKADDYDGGEYLEGDYEGPEETQKYPLEAMTRTSRKGQVSLHLTAVADSVQINNIIVNRGNCGVMNVYSLPISMRYGQTVLFPAFCGRILEVTVNTNTGQWTFNF